VGGAGARDAAVLAGLGLELALRVERAAGALQKQVGALAARELAVRSNITCHGFPLDATALGRTAGIVRNGRDVRDAGDLDAQRVQGAHRRLAAGAGALDADFECLDAVFLCHAASRLGGHLGGERSGFARALEAGTARRRPGQRVALAIGNGDDRVVEGRMNVRDAVRNALLDFLAYARRAAVGSFRHLLILDYFFREAAARRGPLRVRALVRVR